MAEIPVIIENAERVRNLTVDDYLTALLNPRA